MFRLISHDSDGGDALSGKDSRRPVSFTFERRTMLARAGDTVAAALLANGVDSFRETPISGARRGPYCLMGVCFECLVVVDGVGNRQACLTLVKDGMGIERQHGARRPDIPEARRT